MLFDRRLLAYLFVAIGFYLSIANALPNVLLAEEMTSDVSQYDLGDDNGNNNGDLPPEDAATTQPPTKATTIGQPLCSAGGLHLKESRYSMVGSALMIFPSLKITCPGEIAQWEFLSLKSNTTLLYFAVWHHTNPAKEWEFGLRGMNNPNITAIPGHWNTWTVPADKRIIVQPGDVIGYFYVSWAVNVSELIVPLAIPLDDYDKVFFKSQQAGVYATMMGLADVVQRSNGVIDFATQGAFIPNYAIPPIRAVIVPRHALATTTDLFRVRLNEPIRQPLPTVNPDISSPVKRCQHLPMPADNDHSFTSCRPERFLRYFYSQTLKTCVFFYYSTCTDIPGKLPAPIKTGNNFATVDECMSTCSRLIDPSVDPVVPEFDYGDDIVNRRK